MNILCLNTGFTNADIALHFEGKDYFITTDSSAKHSENLLPEIEKLLEKVCKNGETTSEVLNRIDVISVVTGPGSFTGLRIGISTVKAIALTHEHMRIVSLGSLELIAKLSKNKQKTAILDALSGYYFVSCFEGDLCTLEPKMITSGELSNFKNFVSIEKLNFETELVSFSPENLLKLSLEKINKNQFTSEDKLLPLYIRPSQAEANLNENKVKNN